jgi:hypothetical protein
MPGLGYCVGCGDQGPIDAPCANDGLTYTKVDAILVGKFWKCPGCDEYFQTLYQAECEHIRTTGHKAE